MPELTIEQKIQMIAELLKATVYEINQITTNHSPNCSERTK
jgi:hypothetical protein